MLKNSYNELSYLSLCRKQRDIKWKLIEVVEEEVELKWRWRWNSYEMDKDRRRRLDELKSYRGILTKKLAIITEKRRKVEDLMKLSASTSLKS